MSNVPVWLIKSALTCSFLVIIFSATPSYAISHIGPLTDRIEGGLSVIEFEVSATSVVRIKPTLLPFHLRFAWRKKWALDPGHI